MFNTGKDRFAFEMIHFIKSSSINVDKSQLPDMPQIWESHFTQSLETLLAECN